MDKITFHVFCAVRSFLLIAVAVFLIINICVANAHAVWSTDPTVNNAISTAAGSQNSPTIVTDNSGGAIITWTDQRNGDYDIYAQRVDANGNVLWTADGIPISTAANSQASPTIVSDGNGGAIITWYDYRSGVNINSDIYAQRIDANGNVLWTADGVAISTAANHQVSPTIVTDGSGGAVITWMDVRSGSSWDIYAQRIDANGNVLWTIDGVAISTAARDQYRPTIVTDGNGGAIITWQDYRNVNINSDIYAQRIDANGNVLWTLDGVAISTAANNQQYPNIITDGSGGAIITWTDNRRSSYYDIYAQRIDATGNVLWIADGVAISTAAGVQYQPTIVTDGSGGAIITWWDLRNDINYPDIYAQRIDATGNVLWTADGVPISTAAGYQYSPTIVTDGSGGAIITWHDYRSGNYDIYAQRINANGNVLWTADGVPISTAAGYQYSPTIVTDGSGGAIITWHDYRSGNYDIYAQRINANGNVLWTTDGVAISTAANNQEWSTIVADGSGGAIITWQDFRSSNYDIYSQRVSGSGTFTSTLSVSVNGNGSVGSSPAGINCPGDCSEAYALGTSVTLTAAPNSGWGFYGWEGACTGTGACTFNMTVDTSVTANFKQTWFEESDPTITYTGTWSTSACSSCSGGAMKSTSQTGAKADFSFNGTGVRWIASKTSKSGKAKVYIDGVYIATVDLYSKTSKYQVVVFERTGLSPGNHTLTIENPGKRVSINIDAFEVIP
ncbi:MAG: hypothetical protein A3F88_04825 [Deltaproteobacteria bacterium RIFCSPLOWO2_12_FULL_42_16]|nr:MAG: hypothetical protein A3F88_04825 [Deltaproteobacteria bacterium RIFCSPLOWO2_12_FULL_42_16]